MTARKFGWIAFQAWAVYFMAGCTPKGGIQLIPVFGFWAVPLVLLVLVPLILYLDIASELFNFVPAVFVGAGVFFGFMNYVPGASFAAATITEIIYCVLGLAFGFITVTFRVWYEGKYVKK